MSEPHAESLTPREGQEASAVPVPPPDVATGSKVTFALGAEPSDDAPTIISKRVQVNGRMGETFAGSLRGRRLAHFELVEPIGVGGMAAVIQARDTQLDRNVALKILPPDMAKDPEIVKRFHQEARAAAKLDHENIARVFFCGEDEGLHFIAFEFVEGENLRAILERRGRLPVAEALQYILQIATGVAHAATRGVIHRDIKPSNILISSNGRAKLVDMGLARSLEPQVDQGLTQSGVTLGTFDYISPEQAMEPREADVRSDIYSLGCTLYHMLTGKPPVPEGTAAKKLHHHQHVPPLDPRQLNPDIPDDVAAVLGRMMAKDPGDRYQRPEVLVQHLIYLVQKYSDLPAAPEGMLFVDTPLPSPPRLNPLVVAGLAAVFLVAVIALQGMFPGKGSLRLPFGDGGKQPVQADAPNGTSQPVGKNGKPTDDDKPAQVPVDPPAVFEVDNAEAFAKALQTDTPNLEIVVGSGLDVPATANGVGFVYRGAQDRKLTIRAKERVDPSPEIRAIYNADRWQGKVTGTALTLKGGGTVAIRGLRWKVDAGQSQISLAAIRQEDGGSLTIDNCVFDQKDGSDAGQLSSVVVEGSQRENQPVLNLTDCLFLGHETRGKGEQQYQFYWGREAVTVSHAKVVVSKCNFGPHAAVFHLKPAGEDRRTVLDMDECSVMLAKGAVFRADNEVTCWLRVRDSLISRPDSRPSQEVAALIEQGESLGLTYSGERNCYHNLTAFILRPATESRSVQTWEEFQGELRGSGKEASPPPLTGNPWSEKDPLGALARGEPLKAFQLSVNLADLRRSLAGKIVDSEAVVSKPPFYKSLAAALLDAQDNDVIYIKEGKEKRPIDVTDAGQLAKASINVTIKPYFGHRPILTLGRSTNPDPAILQVHDSKVTFQQLEFYLSPQAAFTSQQVVSLVGTGFCKFENCVFTFEPAGYPDVRLAAVVLTDPKKSMKMEPGDNSAEPTINFENCLLRGKGNLVIEQVSRPAKLTIKNSLLALAGSMLNVNGQGETADSSLKVQVSIEKVTALLTNHLMLLRTQKSAKDLVPVESNASDCLFVALDGKSLVHFEGEVGDDEPQAPNCLNWMGRANAYVNFRKMLDHQTPKPTDMGVDKWQVKNPEDHWIKIEKVTGPPMEERDFTRLTPEDLKSRFSDSEFQSYTAGWSFLPKPVWNAK